MISLNNIYIKYADRVLLNKINCTIKDNDKVGLVGRNGAGKSTILKLIMDISSPHEGSIVFGGKKSLGYLHQDMKLPSGKTVMEEASTAFKEIQQIETRIEKINHELETREDFESDAYSKLIQELSDLNEQFYLMGGENSQAETEKILKGLGFKQTDFDRKTEEFSGGWQMRIELAKILLARPKYVLLDEPTNHLDIESIIWLEQFLKKYIGVVILISHDQKFLDQVCNRTIEIELGNLYDYKASYSKYLELKKDRVEKLQASFENQQKVIAEKERTINRFMAKANKTKMAQSMKKQLDKMERIEMITEDQSKMKLRFPPAQRSGDIVMDVVGASKNYGDLNVLDKVNLRLHRAEKMAFVGQNGQGKTTLSKMIIDLLDFESGEIIKGHNVTIGYYAQDQSQSLDPSMTLLETMESNSPPEMRPNLRNILGAFLFSGEDVDKKVSVLSGGERARLALASFLLKSSNLLVLDEPTNHLDITSKNVLKRALMAFDGAIIVVSHDREFLADLTDKTIEFKDKKLREYLGDINYFLEKRKLDNMRELELKPKASSDKKAVKSNENNQIDQRKERDIKNIERKIENKEEEIAKIEKRMAERNFYQSADADKHLAQYQNLKSELADLNNKWEEMIG